MRKMFFQNIYVIYLTICKFHMQPWKDLSCNNPQTVGWCLISSAFPVYIYLLRASSARGKIGKTGGIKPGRSVYLVFCGVNFPGIFMFPENCLNSILSVLFMQHFTYMCFWGTLQGRAWSTKPCSNYPPPAVQSQVTNQGGKRQRERERWEAGGQKEKR